jgi:transcriptional regulator with XRE-family HTH domain
MTEAIDTAITPENRRVGATIRALREAHGLKVVELAIALGVSQPFISNIEAGRKRAPIPLCRQAARIFGVELAAITIADYAAIHEAAVKAAGGQQVTALQKAG